MTLLCALDFSPPSVAAARVAAALAQRFKDRVVLVHALEVVVPPGLGESAAVVQDFVNAQQVAAREALEQVAAPLRALGAGVETRLELGPAPRVIRKLAEAPDVRLVVLASNDRGAVERALMGSVADRVSRETDKPLLVVGDNAEALEAAIRGEGNLRITAGVDQGPASDASLALLREWRAHKGVDLTLVHSYWPPGEAARLGLHAAADLYEPDPEVVAILMRELRQKVGSMDGKGELRWVVQPSMGRPSDRVMDAAAADGSHLVWVGTSAPRGLRRVLPGSSALQVLHGWSGSAVVVPQRYHGAESAHPTLPDFRVFLAVTDFSPLGNQAVLSAISLARVRGGTVHVLHVTDGSVPHDWGRNTHRDVHPDHRHLHERLRALVAGSSSHVTAQLHVVASSSVPTAILQAVERLGADMLVTGHHGKAPAVDVLIGSVAQELISTCTRPVLVLRG